MRRATIYLIGAALALLMTADHARPGMLLAGEADGGGGPYVNLIVREVRVAPIRAHVGDVIRVDVVIEDQSDVRYAKGDLDLRANGRIVTSKRMGDVFGGEGDRIYLSTLQWNTNGVKPGNYRIRVDFHVWGDASEFDNFLDIKEALELLPPGAASPSGKPSGGEAVVRDPRYRPAAAPVEGSGKASGGAAGSGY